MPTCAAITACLPILTLWAICIRLSKLQLSEIIVESKTALSIVVFAPI